jgi:hypothetical protein
MSTGSGLAFTTLSGVTFAAFGEGASRRYPAINFDSN